VIDGEQKAQPSEFMSCLMPGDPLLDASCSAYKWNHSDIFMCMIHMAHGYRLTTLMNFLMTPTAVDTTDFTACCWAADSEDNCNSVCMRIVAASRDAAGKLLLLKSLREV
jgi:hypothetical protein